MSVKLSFNLAILASAFLLPIQIAQAQSCGSPQTTYEIAICESQDLNLADGDLNRIYQVVRSGLDKKGKKILLDAQRSWISYRDMECDRRADFARGGSFEAGLRISCFVNLTSQRIHELNRNPITGEDMQ